MLVVAAFDGRDPKRDLLSFQDDFMLADMAIVQGRIERLRESVKKAKPNRDQELAELHALEPMLATLEEGKSLHGYQDGRRAGQGRRAASAC